ncbi:MAG: sporulation/spore germination protein [Anaerocolumna sp.]|jgi:hypothetical protein|nr:sporulation/spore germination protein [Anaerocolumna sp.]
MKSEVIILKKTIVAVYLMAFLVLLTGCGQQKATVTDAQPTQKPAQAEPSVTPTPTEEIAPSSELTIKDYYPFLKNTDSYYVGEGNEYASFHMYTDYIDDSTNRAQIRINNGGSETVQVIQNKDGKLTLLSSQEETYYRDNLLEKTNSEDKETVILMEPLVKGTSWTLPDGKTRSITGENVSITTPLGEYKALEVTTEEVTGSTIDYYVKDMGLVNRVTYLGDTKITSTLKERKTDVPFIQEINMYHWNLDEEMKKDEVKLELFTNDITRTKLEEYLKSGSLDNQALISSNTKINSMYLGTDNIAYVDFSQEFIDEMNAGAGYETQILQCITNTIGDYYGVKEVYLTVDGNPYESGHIALIKGETFKVDLQEQ